MKFLIELWADGYENEDELRDACVEFIDVQLNSAATSVRILQIDGEDV